MKKQLIEFINFLDKERCKRHILLGIEIYDSFEKEYVSYLNTISLLDILNINESLKKRLENRYNFIKCDVFTNEIMFFSRSHLSGYAFTLERILYSGTIIDKTKVKYFGILDKGTITISQCGHPIWYRNVSLDTTIRE